MTKYEKAKGGVIYVWLGGGGFVISLLGFLFTWKIALTIFCVWLLSWIVFVIKFLLDTEIIYSTKKQNTKPKPGAKHESHLRSK